MFSIFSRFFKIKIKLIICFCVLVWTSLSYSARVNKVSVKGNEIIETELILSHIQLKKGASYSQKTIQKDVRQLFSLGFFDDIKVHRFWLSSKKAWNVVYQLKERLHIGQLVFKGNENIKTDDLKELSLIKEYGFLNFSELQKTLSAIKEKYKEKGYYLAEVSYRTEKIPKEKKLKLLIEIKENTKLLVKRINFIGNRNISSQQLKAFMLTKEKNILSFIGSSGIFRKEHIERDLQFIEYYYRDKGYLNVYIQRPEITITPDKRFLYINFSISEGPRFKVGQVAFRGDDVVPAEEVADRLELKKEEYFSLGRLQKDIQLISLLYKNKGYAFVKVQPQFFPDSTEEDKIHILFKVKKGEKYKLGRIHLLGNKNARDKVIFRRFRIKEGEIYNESKKELSRELIQQLAYFEKVDVQAIPSTKKKNELDLLVRIKERENTGEAHLAGGYNSESKLFIQGGVKKQNFLGLDQSIALNLNFSKYYETFAFSWQSPYFLDSQWNFAFDVFNVGHNTLSGGSVDSIFSQSRDYFSYFQLNTGFSVALGRHLTNFSTVFLKYRLQNQNLAEQPVYFLRDLPVLSSMFEFLFEGEGNQERLGTVVFDDIFNLDEGKGLNSSLSVIFEYDKRNNRYYASKGFFTRLSAQYSGLGGDFDYVKLEGNVRHYYSPFWKLVIKNRLEYNIIFSNDKDKPLLFTELFFLGGPYNLRGFKANSQGPRKYSQRAYDYAVEYNRKIQEAKTELPKKQAQLIELQKNSTTTKETIETIKDEIAQYEAISSDQPLEHPEDFARRPYGGEQMFFYSLELEFPIIESAELRGVFFFDLGEANNEISFDLDDQLRADVGVGIRWKSPFGPIGLDWAFPYKPRKELGEEDWEFQFNVGSQF